ncbi:MAG: Eco57I restriction-modification methylase domain-containing protein [Cyanobacteria bacterium SZAS-4]|nr:Eco57I restriction-modification methylase domain-containing protein [Cyanobacteria bacterium SZAS-4]
MTRTKKASPRKESILARLKEDAVQFVQERIAEICTRTKTENCNCTKILPDLYVDAIKALSGRSGDEEHAVAEHLVDEYPVEELSDLLSQVYEHLLLYTVKSARATTCAIDLITKSKKRLGNFYTPRDLAEFTVTKALHELVYQSTGELKSAGQILKLKVVDPSMGSGTFLRAALEYLAERLKESRAHSLKTDSVDLSSREVDSGEVDSREADSVLMSCRRDVLRSCLYGVDLDDAAVKVARFLLAMQCGAGCAELERDLATRLRCGDSLVGITPKVPMRADSIPSANAACNEFFGLTANAEKPFNYFHWALQFPDVFQVDKPGFDAVIGNPPWEIVKPNSREFFQRKHSQYWTLGKQEALRKQDELRSETQIDEEWNQYQHGFKLFSQWISKSGAFQLQGSSDVNAYKLFVELSLVIAKTHGVVSLIVPSSLYSDKGSLDLREALLKSNDWKFLHSFQNAEGLFDIHRSFKFCVVLSRKGGVTSKLTAHFDARNVSEARLVSPCTLDVEKLQKLSPRWLSVPEVESAKDLELAGKIGSNAIRFEDFVEEFDLKFRREFDMTNDSHRFILRDDAEHNGYRADARGRWIRGAWTPFKQDVELSRRVDRGSLIASADGAFEIAVNEIEDVALPLYEGRMIGQFDVAQKGWVHGKGRQALWLPVPDGRIMPQYLLAAKDYDVEHNALKVAFLGVGSSTNVRSMIAACLGCYPCGNSVPTFHCADSKIALLLTACLNSFVFDYMLRMRLVGNNLNYFILQESYLPRPDLLMADSDVLKIAAKLSFNPKHCAPPLEQFLAHDSLQDEIDEIERMRLRCILDVLIADMYGLSGEDLNHILRGCETNESGTRKNSQQRLSPRGFWRVDKNRPVQARQTVLTLNAFAALKELGRERFLAQNDFAGWKLPVEASAHF